MSKRFEPFSSASSSENISRSKRLASSVPRLLRRRQRRDLVDQLVALLVVDRDPGIGLLVFFDGAAMLADDEVVEVQAGDGLLQRLQRVRADIVLARRRLAVRPGFIGRRLALGKSARLAVLLVQRAHQIEPRREQPLGQRFRGARLLQLRVGAEELEVLAVVEDVEELLVLARAEQVRAEPRAAADHLPELGLRAHQLEEDEVHDLGHVDAGVEHVDRDGDVRRLVLVREVVDQALRVLRS